MSEASIEFTFSLYYVFNKELLVTKLLKSTFCWQQNSNLLGYGLLLGSVRFNYPILNGYMKMEVWWG